jgi:cysteine synthase A
MRVVKDVLGLIGGTPLVRINKLCGKGYADIYASVKFMNPSGSIKDEMVHYIIEQAEKRGELKKGQLIVEATTGNTGISLAMVAAVKGYKTLVVIPNDNIKKSKRKMIELLGAEVVLIPPKLGVEEVVKEAARIAKSRHAFLLNQFENPDNVNAHENISGREILKGMVGRVDSFVASVGTGGTLIGIARALKKARVNARIVAVEPERLPMLYCKFYGKPMPSAKNICHKIDGTGEGFVPKVLEENMKLIDDVILVSDKDAIDTAVALANKEGMLVGPSSGANVFVAMKEAKRLGSQKVVVTVLPDSGQRYVDTNAFD